jgi:hypothetical protein
MDGQMVHHPVSRKMRESSVIACVSAAGEPLRPYLVTSQNVSSVQAQLRKQALCQRRNLSGLHHNCVLTPVPLRSTAHIHRNQFVRFVLRFPSIHERSDPRRASGGTSQPRKGKKRTPATLPTATRLYHGQRESSSVLPTPISLTSRR